VPEVRKATVDDVPRLSESLARAFHDDPPVTWIYPTHARRRRFFEIALRMLHLRHDEVYTTDEAAGAAMWDPPGHWKLSVRDMVRTGPAMARVTGRNSLRGMRLMSALDRRHPTEPHWYLAVLGTHPDHQGKGVGSALLAPVLARCDAEGSGAYLESSKESNVPFYRRYGFEVTERLELPGGGPPVWLMWREPRAA
jgi:ribosomal protein S18 acetylase RimI-like enzyme